jgi:hypothetical protein
MRASIGLAILKGNLNLGEIAKQVNVTPERVTPNREGRKGLRNSEK